MKGEKRRTQVPPHGGRESNRGAQFVKKGTKTQVTKQTWTTLEAESSLCCVARLRPATRVTTRGSLAWSGMTGWCSGEGRDCSAGMATLKWRDPATWRIN